MNLPPVLGSLAAAGAVAVLASTLLTTSQATAETQRTTDPDVVDTNGPDAAPSVSRVVVHNFPRRLVVVAKGDLGVRPARARLYVDVDGTTACAVLFSDGAQGLGPHEVAFENEGDCGRPAITCPGSSIDHVTERRLTFVLPQRCIGRPDQVAGSVSVTHERTGAEVDAGFPTVARGPSS